jgi:histidinol dehydrogenase
MKSPRLPILTCPGGRVPAALDKFFRRPAISSAAEEAARRILDDIRADGDAAVLRWAHRFDTPGLTARALRVTAREIDAACAGVDPAFARAARAADRNIRAFAKAGMRKNWKMRTPGGGSLGEVFHPFDRVGVYIPGGTAPLVSTSLMTASIASTAGVREIVACTPADKEGRVNPDVLFALNLAGVSEIYRVGGVQAIGAMALGTRTIRPVQKIVGPGNAYVAAAKKLVYGIVSLDSVAGPSEIAVLADDTARARHVAADLLSQAEHGTGEERALLVTTSAELAREVDREVWAQLATLPRAEMTLRVLEKGVRLVVTDSLEAGADIINRFAPEHLEILTRKPERVMRRITAAGAIFLGPWTPESAGDFAAGPSHVLPTGGSAAKFAGLTVDDFRRRSSVLALTRRDLERCRPIIRAFGRVEGLEGHVRSAEVRFE